MQRFTQLYTELDETNSTNAKIDALKRYFNEAAPADAAYALYFLTGNRQRRVISGRVLREWVSDLTGLPLWLVEESYSAVGDIAETMALLLQQAPAEYGIAGGQAASTADAPDLAEGAIGGAALPLHKLVAERITPLAKLDDEGRRLLVFQTWQELSIPEIFVYHKLITGEFRVGVGRTLVVRALAEATDIPRDVMEHRIMGNWRPTPASYIALLDPDTTETDQSRPYPFYLAYQLDDKQQQDLSLLGDVDEWQIEWKWDGIRAQVIHRGTGDEAQVLVWTRGEELVTDAYPELERVGAALPPGTVIDGELLAWNHETSEPLPFNALQRRLGRKKLTKKLLREVPAALVAYDLLEWQGEDVREWSLEKRRATLATLVDSLSNPQAVEHGGTGEPLNLSLSPVVKPATWTEAAALREESRARRAEGFMLKRHDSPYLVGRKKGDWWKWKIDPFTVDAVMIYAQRGSGRRASLYSDYTFAVWDGDDLVPVTKAYSGLTDEEMRQVDAWVRRNTRERFGPVRSVTPHHVFEIGFEGIQASSRHKSGIALRFPRMLRWRQDKPIEEADTLEFMRALLAQIEGE